MLYRNKKQLTIIMALLFSIPTFSFVNRLRMIGPALKAITGKSIETITSPVAEVTTECGILLAQIMLGSYCLLHEEKSKNSYFHGVAALAFASGFRSLSTIYSVMKKNNIPFFRFYRHHP